MKKIVLFAILLIAACKTDEQLMDPWKGRNKIDLVAHWGKPTSIVPDGEGGEVYEYAIMLHSPNTSNNLDPTFYRVKCFYVHADGTVYYCKCEDSRTPKVNAQ